MAETTGSGGPVITGAVPFYKRPEPLTPDRHGKLGVKRIDKPFLFAKTTQVVPLTIGEFSAAALDYPIIFSEPERVPLAVMGLVAEQNLFIGDDGVYESYRYVPAFIRRYPFVFAEDRANNRFIACIDVEAPMVAESADQPLFKGAEATEFTKGAVQFLTNFEQQRRETQAFVNRLTELDLFDKAKVTIARNNPDGTPADDPMLIGEYVGVANQKLEALPPDTLDQLHRSGHLGAIFVHLHSLRNWSWLIQRTADAQARQGGARVN